MGAGAVPLAEVVPLAAELEPELAQGLVGVLLPAGCRWDAM